MRQLDPQLGRWHSIDLMAESYDDQSPYQYAMNNPICNIDVDGMFSWGKVFDAAKTILTEAANAVCDFVVGGHLTQDVPGGKIYPVKNGDSNSGYGKNADHTAGSGQTQFTQIQNDNEKPQSGSGDGGSSGNKKNSSLEYVAKDCNKYPGDDQCMKYAFSATHDDPNLTEANMEEGKTVFHITVSQFNEKNPQEIFDVLSDLHSKGWKRAHLLVKINDIPHRIAIRQISYKNSKFLVTGRDPEYSAPDDLGDNIPFINYNLVTLKNNSGTKRNSFVLTSINLFHY